MRVKEIFTSLLLLVFLVGCKPTEKYQLVAKDVLSISKATYSNWTSGVKGGGSKFHIDVLLKDTNDVELVGVYFREGYASFKVEGSNFKASVRGTANSEGIEPESKLKREVKKEPIPFQLKYNEAVISFRHKGKLKYQKITLKEKETRDNIPM